MSKPADRTIQIIVILLAALLLGVGWSYERSLASFQQRETDARAEVARLAERIATTRSTIQEARSLENEAQEARKQIARLGDDLPAGPAAKWMPALLAQHLTARGMKTCVIQMGTIREEPDLPGFLRSSWSVGLPLAEGSGNTAGPLFAMAGFKQHHPFVRVLDFAIRTDPENPRQRIAHFNLAVLMRK